MKCVYEKKAFEQQSPAVQFVMLYLRGGDFSLCSFTLKLCRSLVAPALASDFRIVKLERSTPAFVFGLKKVTTHRFALFLFTIVSLGSGRSCMFDAVLK